MFIKLGIIIGIVILGGVIFSNEINNLFPTGSASTVDSLKENSTDFDTKFSDSVEKRIDESIDKIVDKTSNIPSEISETGNKITGKISETQESSKKIINEEISNLNPTESIQNIFKNNLNSQNSKSGSSASNPESSGSSASAQNYSPMIYETLSLSTTQQPDGSILLQYYDSSGKTKNVSVVIRTAEKEIFSGTFFTSIFETTVNDAVGIPYYIDIIVEHENYGTVTSSVFNPGDTNLKISGIFSQS